MLKGERRVGFQVALYDRTKPLTIDPVLVYSTYLGGSAEDNGSGIEHRQFHRAVMAPRMDITALMREPGVADALGWIDAQRTRIVDETVRICEIPAPTFEEQERAAYVRTRFEALGLTDVAAEADMLVDMRSVDASALADVEWRVLAIVKRAAAEGDGRVEIEMVGDRPAGAIPAGHPLVQTCMAVHRALGLSTVTEPASTDANVPLGLGLPGVCLCITQGENEHRLDEYIETGPIPTGVKSILLAAVSLTIRSRGATPALP